MAELFHTLGAEGIEVTLDLRVGHIRSLVVTRGGRRLAPFHTAPWVDDPSITSDETIPANLRYLSGDFFCAPFSTSDIEDAPPHGWTANSPWRLIETLREPDGVTAVYRLERTVMGAEVEKRFTLRKGHPFLYETHVFSGGSGAVPVANHAMVRLPAGGRLAFSTKDGVETPQTPIEADPAIGRSRLAYPASASDPLRMPLADGGFADLCRYPFAERHEDFVTLVEHRDNRLGWFAASRPDSCDAMISLKNPQDYPVTFLWFSNGGRDYAPWNGRHIAVLGIEEGRANATYGHRASIEPNALSNAGVPTALALSPGGRVAVKNVIGAVPLGASGSPITDIKQRDGALELLCEDGTRFDMPFDTAFLDRA
jgi:hypothetical protein